MRDVHRIELSALVTHVTRKIAFDKDPSRPYLSLEHLSPDSPHIASHGRAIDSISTNTVFQTGDVLFGKLRPNLRKCVSAPFDGYCSTDILVLRPNPELDPGFVGRLFQSNLVHGPAVQSAIGTGMPRTSWSILKRCEVPVVPKNEQRLIAEILDTVDAAIRKTEAIIAKLGQVKQGLLHDLLTRGIDENGQLRDPDRHPEQFKDSPLGRIPKGWKVRRLADLTDPSSPITYGVVKPGAHVEHGVLFVRGGDFPNGRIQVDRLRTISKRIDQQYSRTRLRGGEVLVSLVGQPGSSAVVPDSLAGANIARQAALVRTGVQLESPFLHTFVSSSRGQKALLSDTLGSVQQVVNLRDLRELPIPLPELSEQQQISNVLEEWQTRINTEGRELHKLRLLKQGLMDDLLTGRVRVTNLLQEAAT